MGSQPACPFLTNTVICAVHFLLFAELKQKSKAELKIIKPFGLVEIISESRKSCISMCLPKILVRPCPVGGS